MSEMWSVLIRYEEQELRPYICLSEYLRLSGFVVGDGRYIDNRNNQCQQDSGNYLITLYLSKNMDNMSTEFGNCDIDLSDVISNEPNNGGGGEKGLKACRQLLDAFLYRLYKKGIFLDAEYRTLHMLSQYYIDNHLMIHEYNCEHYFYVKEAMNKAYEVYQMVEDSLFSCYREAYNSDESLALSVIEFARCYCAGRILEIEDNLEIKSRFNFAKVVQVVDRLMEINPKIIAGHYLQGQMYERKGKWRTAYQKYQNFLKYIDQKEILADVWYRLGKTTEELYDLNIAYPYYRKSQDIKNNYPAEYKLVVYEEFIRKDYMKAAQIYLKMISRFIGIKRSGYMQPQELEYLFKLYFRFGRLWLRRIRNMSEAKKNFQNAEEIENITLDQMNFFSCFYGEEAKQYLEWTIQRLPMYQIRINRQEAEWNQNI